MKNKLSNVAVRRRQIQHSADGEYPYIDSANAGMTDLVAALRWVRDNIANFARTGNPSQPGLTWTPTDPDSCKTMVFDNVCRMADDPEGELRKIILS